MLTNRYYSGPVSEANRNAIFADIKKRLTQFPEIGKFNQEL